MSIVEKAKAFAIERHGGQKRKYTGEPYWQHPERVARIVRNCGLDDTTIAAAWLHDVLEDTETTEDQIEKLFGLEVTCIVKELTDVKDRALNRRIRKAKDRERLSNASEKAQTIKIADLIDNTESIVKYDPRFAKLYLFEKEQLLAVLTKGHARLRELAITQLRVAQRELNLTQPDQ